MYIFNDLPTGLTISIHRTYPRLHLDIYIWWTSYIYILNCPPTYLSTSVSIHVHELPLLMVTTKTCTTLFVWIYPATYRDLPVPRTASPVMYLPTYSYHHVADISKVAHMFIGKWRCIKQGTCYVKIHEVCIDWCIDIISEKMYEQDVYSLAGSVLGK